MWGWLSCHGDDDRTDLDAFLTDPHWIPEKEKPKGLKSKAGARLPVTPPECREPPVPPFFADSPATSGASAGASGASAGVSAAAGASAGASGASAGAGGAPTRLSRAPRSVRSRSVTPHHPRARKVQKEAEDQEMQTLPHPH